MAPAFGQRDREKESVDNYDVHVCLVKVCDNRVTKYVSIQTRERPGPARGKMVVRSEYGSSVQSETMVRPCETRRWFVRAKRDDGSSVRNETMVRPCETRRWFARAKRDDGSSVRSETMEARIERAVHETKFASTCRL